MRIGIDVDDVLADFIPAFRKICQDLHGKPEGDILPCDWNWSNFGLTPEEINASWDAVAGVINFHLGLPPLPDTDRLEDLDDEHELYFITARRSGRGLDPRIQTAIWLEEHYGLLRPAVIVSHDKLPIAQALKLDVFIDDRADTCEKLQMNLPDCRVFVKDCAHNQHCHPQIERVNSLNEFAGRILDRQAN